MSLKRIDIDSLTYSDKYSSDIKKREKLYPLFERVFGISISTFTDLSNRGLWNDDYLPYTFFDGNQAVANVSAFPLPMNINGKFTKCMGIQSVMTHPDYRNKGLMKKLFQRMLDDLDQGYEGAVLFTSSPELYTPYGFKVIEQYYFKKDFNQTSTEQKSSLQKLDPLSKSEDLKVIKDIFKTRGSLSKFFAPDSYLNCLYFNFYNPYIYEKLFYVAELKTIVVFEVVEGTLQIFDVIGEKMPTLESLCSYIPYVFNTIEFYFNPDVFNLADLEAIEFKTQNKLMVRGSFRLENQLLMMPITCEF